MTQTFTPLLQEQPKTEEEKALDLPDHSEPSALTITNILNYSRNLEIRNSALIKEFEMIKS
jgi:hypothetical protein